MTGQAWRRRLVAAGLVGLLAAGVPLLCARAHLQRPVGGEAPLTIVVARGMTLRSALDQLADQGAIARPRWLYAYARLHGLTEIRAGEYEVKPEQSPLDILHMLVEGRVKLESFTLAEGLNRWQVRDLLAAAGWVAEGTFDRLCDDRSFLEHHGIPGPTCEGYLFPETYTLARGVAPEQVFVSMFVMFQRTVQEITKTGTGPLQLSQRDFVTLASIVEEETGAPEERGRIACVFYNRLSAKKRWRLQTDPSVIYAARLADPAFDGNLREEHLRSLQSPYNTYLVYGLPPGPIANPGRAAMRAVAEPDSCSDFFFVAMNNGRHEFCATLDCHNRAVHKWQKAYYGRP